MECGSTSAVLPPQPKDDGFFSWLLDLLYFCCGRVPLYFFVYFLVRVFPSLKDKSPFLLAMPKVIEQSGGIVDCCATILISAWRGKMKRKDQARRKTQEQASIRVGEQIPFSLPVLDLRTDGILPLGEILYPGRDTSEARGETEEEDALIVLNFGSIT